MLKALSTFSSAVAVAGPDEIAVNAADQCTLATHPGALELACALAGMKQTVAAERATKHHRQRQLLRRCRASLR